MPANSQSPRPRLFLIVASLTVLAVVAVPALAQWQAGVEAFERGDFAVAESAFAAQVADNPEWYGGHLMLGRTRLELDRPAEALDSLGTAWRLSPTPEIALVIAHTALENDRVLLAAEVLAEGPGDALDAAKRARWHHLRARVAVERERPAEALADFAAASRLTPDDFLLRLAHGAAALDAAALDAADLDTAALEVAFDELETALRLGPDEASAHRHLLRAWLVRIESSEDAALTAACARAFERGRELVRVDDRASHLFVTGRLGLCAGRVADAEPYFARLLAGGEWRGGYYLGRSQLVQQRFGDAISTLEPLLAEDDLERRRSVHRLLGLAREATGAYDQAIVHYRSASDTEGVARAEANKAHRDEQPLRDMLEQMRRLERDLSSLSDLEVGES